MAGRNHSTPQRYFLIACLLLLLNGCSLEQKPNVLILFLDDFGYNDLGFNSQVNNASAALFTPNMDAFAQQSLSFSRHYTESTCSPSRAALLSGLYPARLGFNTNGRGLPPEITTLPEALQDDGYATRFLGKWHTGDTTPLAYPHNQGFDTWLGFLNQWMLRSEFDPAIINLEQPTYLNPWLEDESGTKQQYQGHLNNLLTNHAMGFIQESAGERDPWFLQVSYYAPHEPVRAADQYQSLYEDTPEGQYRALVHQLDANIGLILDTLEESQQSDNTIVVIVSDNGGTNLRFSSNEPFPGEKANYLEGGVRTPLMIRWPDGFMSGMSYPYAMSLMDLYPTILAATNTEYDADSIDGRNLLPLLETEEKLNRALYWETRLPDGYIYSVLDQTHQWRYSTGYFGEEWLFDLDQDPTSANGVQNENPQIAQQLEADYNDWHDSVHRVQTEFTSVDQSGKGILTGDSFQRSPGFGGFTFAVGITPDTDTDTGQAKVIASQSQLLSVVYENESVRVGLQDVQLNGPLPADGQCHSFIVTAQHDARISWLMAGRPMSTPIDLIIDGNVVDSLFDGRELPKAADLTAPTYIGYRPGEPPQLTGFSGQLSEPVIYNRKLDPNIEAGQFDIASLMQEVCPDD